MTNTTNYRDPDRGFRVFGAWEIVAPNSNGRWVPNVNDLIFDPQNGYRIVVSVDPTTDYSTLIPWNPIPDNSDDAGGTLTAVGPGYSSESYRMFIDTSVTPNQLTPDFRLHLYGSQAQYYVVFRGSDISEATGEIISAMYDSSKNFLGVTVPMEVVYQGNQETTIKTTAPGYTNAYLENGERVTLVVYSADGIELSQAQLNVVHSKAVRRADASKRYVEGIAIESPFISTADPSVIEFPLNVTVESLPLTAVAYYSDGSRSRQSVQGGQFQLLGLRNYIATEPGQQFPLVLSYSLAQDEVSFNITPTADRLLTRSYKARTVAADGAYEVKIFGFPVWVNAQSGYRMEYWLYNLDRQTYYNVTPYVELATNSNAFNPTQYGVMQTFTIALDLNKVDGRFAPYRAVQIMRVALISSGANQAANWEVLFDPTQVEGYGRGMVANTQFLSVNNWRLNLGMGLNNVEQWLNKMYYNTQPLFNQETEEEAPRPTHFILQFLNNAYEYPISEWNQNLNVNNDLQNGELLWIRWIRRTVITDLQLATTALPIMRS